MNLLGCNQGWVLEGKVQGSGCEGAGMAVQMLSWGLPLGKEAEIELWVGKREDPPPLWSAGQEGLISALHGVAREGVQSWGQGVGRSEAEGS